MALPTAEPVEDIDYEALPPNFSVAQNMAAGSLAGIAEHTLMYPIDAIKTRLQIVNPTPSAVYNGMIQGGYRIATREGVRNLWRGMSSVVIGAGPAHAAHFVVLEKVNNALGGNGSGYHFIAPAIGGAAGTMANDALMNPFDVIKQRMQMQNSSKMYKSMAECARYIHRTEGLRAFYVSYPTTISMTVPHTGIQFVTYSALKTLFGAKTEYNAPAHCVAGALSGGFAAALTTPMDVVKTMLQTRGSASDPELRKVNGLVEGVKLLHRREGFRGFYKGINARVITAMPSTAICWTVYEAFKGYFISRNDAIV